jgi:hypothetical protein
MATRIPTADEKLVDKIVRLSSESQRRLVTYARSILEKNNQFQDLRRKMDNIDVAYARYQESAEQAEASDGVDVRAGNTGCDVFANDDVVPPIVVSQVDSYVAYLAEVFLSGQPLFPIVSNPTKRKAAEILEALIDDHAIIGGYARQLLLFLRDGCKYNFSALEVDWDSIDQFSVLNDVTRGTGQSIQRKPKKFTRVLRLNPRNVVWDWSLAPGDVAEHGDYAGHISQMSRTKLKRQLNKWSIEHKAYNVEKAMLSSGSVNPDGFGNYYPDPTISNYQVNSTRGRNAAPNWDYWFEPGKNSGRRGPPVLDTMYEKFVLYARIMPAEFGIAAPQPNTPQIWKLIFINGNILVYAERIISAYDYLPVLFGQPLEDGLNYQTQSIAEGEIPFQAAANTLFNIRFAAARRAVSDRALYIPDMIKPSDINSKHPAPKIPVSITALSQKGIDDAYKQIPFDMRGTETTIQDASLIVQFSKELHGVNSPRQGQFQKGNKSVQEWTDTMGGSDGRMRLPALVLEHQVFSPLKSMISLNILQYGEDGHVVSHLTGNELEFKISELRAANLSFKVADGYTPKSKLASTEVIAGGMNLIMNSPMLQQAYGASLPSMFAHFMSLSGVRGFEQYDPSFSGNQQPAPLGLPTNNLQPEPQPGQSGQPPAQIPANNAQPIV